jgi:hypothetical protein
VELEPRGHGRGCELVIPGRRCVGVLMQSVLWSSYTLNELRLLAMSARGFRCGVVRLSRCRTFRDTVVLLCGLSSCSWERRCGVALRLRYLERVVHVRMWRCIALLS